jgi:hypothetical protein
MRNSKYVVCLLGLTLLALTAAAAAPALKFTFKDVMVPGANETDTYAINDKGVITGDYIDSAGVQHGMIINGKKVTTIDNSSCTSVLSFYGINSFQTLAGWCNSPSIAFTYSKGKFTTISPPGTISTQANGINDKGDVVGCYTDSSNAQHGFVLKGTTYTTLNPPGVSTALVAAWSINNAGVIGIYGLNSAETGYISFTTKNDGKTYKSFAYSKAGSEGTAIHAVANNGDIDGTYFDSAVTAHGVLFHKNKYYPFSDPNAGTVGTRADGLNIKMQIVGRYTDSSSITHGFEAKAK